MTAVQSYIARIDSVEAQRQRLYGAETVADVWGGQSAQTFRADPRRSLDPNLATIASYLEPQDVFVDVGGGAGRVSLPMAIRCREVLTVEPSPGMADVYRELAAENQITNASIIPSSWLEAERVRGDLVFAADVTYFVRDIEGFIERMTARANRRAMITVWSEPPPNRGAEMFRLIYGEEQARLPGHRDLLPVLWKMGLLPDVTVLSESPWWESVPQSRAAALDLAIAGRWLKAEDRDRAQTLVDERFDELFDLGDAGYQPRWRPDMRELLITWETGQR